MGKSPEAKGLLGLLIGLFRKEVPLIEFQDFCSNAYEGITNLANQGNFVEGIFKAAGSNYTFSTSDRYSRSNYPTKLFNGGKPLSSKIRKSFPNPIDKKNAAAYLEKHIAADKVRTVMNKFALPGNAEQSLTALSWALAEQLQIIIQEPDNDTNVVISEYLRYLTEASDSLSSPFQPLYDADSYWNQSDRNSTHALDFYEKITHKWVIKNTGKVRWTSRKLICSNHKQIPPRADYEVIEVPDTKPGDTATIEVAFDARGAEGQFVSTWRMEDAEGNDCFPEGNSALSVTINVVNKAFSNNGGNKQ